MGFYDVIAKDVPWEYTTNAESYLKWVDGKIQLPKAGWLQYHLGFLDKIIETLHAYRNGALQAMQPYDLERIEKHVIYDPEEATNFLGVISNKYKVFSIDIETSNLLTDKAKNCLLGIGIAYEEEKAVCFEVTCFRDTAFKKLFNEFVQRKDFIFILHNGIFDRSRTQLLEDITISIGADTMLMHYCGINEHKGTHGLKDLAQLYLGFPDWEKPLDEWKKQYCRANKIKLKEFEYSYFPRQMLLEYCCYDVCATFQLYYTFLKLMRPETIMIYNKLIEASEFYADMIVRGMKLNEPYWFELEKELTNEQWDLEDWFESHLPGVNIGSPIQLKKVLQDHFTDEIIESTNKRTMGDLQFKYPDDELLQKILRYRKVQKYLQTYLYGIYERLDANKTVHCEFKLHGTETGRLSSANPNMQNIPRDSKIKNLFIAHDGYKLIQLDYSQCELRVLAYISKDEKLLDCYREGRDLHTEMAMHLFGDNYDPHNKDQRVIAKTINFGIPYGRTAGGIVEALHIPMWEARKYLNDWFKGAPKVKDFIEECHRDALADPQNVYVTPFGRSRRYYVTSETAYHVKNQAVNFPISSTANDLTICSVVEIGKWLKEKGFDAYLVNTVHDSIIIEAREKDIQEIAEHCKQIMEEMPNKYLPDISLPFRADIEIGDSYGALSEPDWYYDEEEDE